MKNSMNDVSHRSSLRIDFIMQTIFFFTRTTKKAFSRGTEGIL